MRGEEPQRGRGTRGPAPARGSNADRRVSCGLLCTNFPRKYLKLLVLERDVGLSSRHGRPRQPCFLCRGHFSGSSCSVNRAPRIASCASAWTLRKTSLVIASAALRPAGKTVPQNLSACGLLVSCRVLPWFWSFKTEVFKGSREMPRRRGRVRREARTSQSFRGHVKVKRSPRTFPILGGA